jgi:hypothetical protein
LVSEHTWKWVRRVARGDSSGLRTIYGLEVPVTCEPKHCLYMYEDRRILLGLFVELLRLLLQLLEAPLGIYVDGILGDFTLKMLLVSAA